MPIDSIIQAGLLAFVLIVVFLFLVFSMLLAGSLKKRTQVEHENGDVIPPDDTQNTAKEVTETQEDEEKSEEIPIYEKYDQIYRLEILYWRGISKPWWWNNYAEELLHYVDEYFPKSHVNFFATYNSNSAGPDYNNPSYARRIQALRPHKKSKHPLIVINYNQEYFMIDSHPALEEFKDRVDAEWYRHYKFKKTYRNSPISFTK